MKFYCEYVEGFTRSEVVDAESHQEACDIIKHNHPSVTYISASYYIGQQVHERQRFFELVLDRKPGETSEETFLDYVQTMLYLGEEKPDTAETIGLFCKNHAMFKDGKIHALMVFDTDEDGTPHNIIEYFVTVEDGQTIRHRVVELD